MSLKYADESFKKIPGHEQYSCSNYGRFKKGRKLITTTADREGYRLICLNGKRYRAHRIVAQVWCENPDPENYTVVDHINSIKDDNRSCNLRWCSQQMNSMFAVEQNRNKGKRAGYVIAIDKKTRDAKIYNRQVDAATELGINPRDISACICGTKLQTNGYMFFRVESIRGVIMDQGDNMLQGRTMNDGHWAEVTKDLITLKIIDERPEHLQMNDIHDICNEYLDNYKLK